MSLRFLRLFVPLFLLPSLLEPMEVGAVEIPASTKEDPCANQPAVLSCENEAACDKGARINALCDLRTAFLRHYAGLYQKNERIKKAGGKPFDSMEHLNSCIQIEVDYREPPSLDQYREIYFLDRIRKCLAAFQDRHLDNLDGLISLPSVYAGFDIVEIGSKFFISSVDATLLAADQKNGWQLDNLQKALKPGVEVLSFDGEPVNQWIPIYSPYVMSSSEGGRRVYSVEAITWRNYLYPTNGTFTITVTDGKSKPESFQLSWWSLGEVSRRPDVDALFKNLRVQNSKPYSMKYDSDSSKWIYADRQILGFQNADPILPTHLLKEKTITYVDGKDNSALRFASFKENDRDVCYLQVRTFDAEKIKKQDSTTEQDWVKVVAEALTECQQNGAKLILDLRKNPGGMSNYSRFLYSLLTKPGESPALSTEAFRPNRSIVQFLQKMLVDPEIPGSEISAYDGFAANPPRVLREIQNSMQANGHHTNIFVQDPVSPPSKLPKDFKFKIFTGDIVALITPECISACDAFAALLKLSDRAKLVGSPTQGTGMGMIEDGEIDSQFKDKFGILRLTIPNRLFGVTKNKALGSMLNYETEASETLLENRPTLPDTPYETSLEDIRDDGAGWYKAALLALGIEKN